MVNHLNSLDGGSSVFLSRAESLSRYRQMMVYTKLKPSSSFRITERPWLANSNHFSSLLIGTRVGLVFIDVHFGMPVRNFLSTLLD